MAIFPNGNFPIHHYYFFGRDFAISYWHNPFVLSWYLHQLRVNNLSHSLTQFETPGPIDRIPCTHDKKHPLSWKPFDDIRGIFWDDPNFGWIVCCFRVFVNILFFQSLVVGQFKGRPADINHKGGGMRSWGGYRSLGEYKVERAASNEPSTPQCIPSKLHKGASSHS